MKPPSSLDPFLVFRYLVLVVRFWVRTVGWRWIGVGWAVSLFGIVVYEVVT